MTYVFKGYVKIVETYAMKFNVLILKKASNNGFFGKYKVYTYTKCRFK